MSFKDAANFDKIQEYYNEIKDSVNSIEEYGYCSVHSNDEDRIKNLSSELIELLKKSSYILDNLCVEMVDSYGN